MLLQMFFWAFSKQCKCSFSASREIVRSLTFLPQMSTGFRSVWGKSSVGVDKKILSKRVEKISSSEYVINTGKE